MGSQLFFRRRQSAAAACLLLVLAICGEPLTASAAAEPVSGKHWVWPIEGPHPVARPFIAPESTYSAGHRGIDISASTGVIVRSPADGVIHFSGFVATRNVVSIDHGDGVLSSFEPVLPTVVEGTLVHGGEAIGTLQPGHCASSCLHFGVRIHGQYVSPMNFLAAIPRSVLLPTRAIRLDAPICAPACP